MERALAGRVAAARRVTRAPVSHGRGWPQGPLGTAVGGSRRGGARRRASALWSTHWERPRRPWQGRRRRERRRRREHQGPGRQTVPGRIFSLFFFFFFFSRKDGDMPDGLYAPRPTDRPAQDTLLGAVDMRMSPAALAACVGTEGAVEGADAPPQGPARPQTPASSARLAGELTNEELSAVYKRLPRGKAPGDDGLPYEFYVAFQRQLAPRLLAVLNAAKDFFALSCLRARPGCACAFRSHPCICQ